MLAGNPKRRFLSVRPPSLQSQHKQKHEDTDFSSCLNETLAQGKRCDTAGEREEFGTKTFERGLVLLTGVARGRAGESPIAEQPS